MIKIDAIFFDYDGVMTLDKTGTDSICNYISRKINIDKNIFEKEYRKYNNELLYGKITHIEIWDKLCMNIGINIPISILYDSFIQTPIDDIMHKLVLEIKQKNIKTGLITDNKIDRIKYICDHHELQKYFDIIAVSGELGYGKESEKIFVKVLEELKIKPEESIFIDNQEKNLVFPQKIGMKTIYFDDIKRDINKLKEEIKEYGAKI
jgi:putative hydrolase of the HAD superfamily